MVFNLLKRLIERDFARNIVLYFNTNGSIFPYNYLHLLKNFKSIELSFSIDSIGDKFKYVRHPLDYTELEQNINNWRNFFKQNNIQYHMQGISTVSILNIWDFPEINKEVIRLLGDPPFWNLLVWPSFYSIKNIPDNVKLIIKEKLLQSAINKDELNPLVNFMMQPYDIKEWNEFKNITKLLDNVRKESFEQTFPEFSKVLNENS